jgi:hypothetical protein
MEVRMEQTQGLGRLAEVWLGGHPLMVCDGLSSRQKRCPPGIVENVRFTYVTTEPVPWEQAVADNPSHKRMLAHVREWSYIGYGRVVGIMPTTIDFGLLRMEDPNWTHDERLVGQYVKVAIDRLDISPAIEQDWPANAR